MEIEYEATFGNIDKEKIRERLKKAGAKLIKKEFLQKRVTFKPPEGSLEKKSWARVRDEGDKITMSLKTILPGSIEGQKEIQLVVDSYDKAASFLESSGFEKKSYQETLRELWILDEVEVTIDTWPYLEPILEVEGKNENDVKKVSEKIGLNYSEAIFEGIDHFYNLKYGTDKFEINNKIPLITFDSPNPFIK